MSSLNHVIVMGTLGQDPELRYTASQTPVASLSVATNEYRTGQDGEKVQTTEWHKVVVWSKMAENCAKYLAKGRQVLVEGRLATRSWDDKQGGGKRYATEIIASNVQFLGGAQGGQAQGAQKEKTTTKEGKNHGSSDQSADASPPYDDVPF